MTASKIVRARYQKPFWGLAAFRREAYMYAPKEAPGVNRSGACRSSTQYDSSVSVAANLAPANCVPIPQSVSQAAMMLRDRMLFRTVAGTVLASFAVVFGQAVRP
jgi:hypothetical protein